MSTNRQIAIDSIKTTFASLFVSLVSFAVSIIVVRQFGASVYTDSYFIALSIPALFTASLFGALKATFVPIYHEWINDHPHDESNLLGSAYFVIGLISICAMIVFLIILPWVIPYLAGGLDSNGQQATLILSRELIPLVFLTSIIGLMGSIYNAKQRFLAPILSPFVRAIVLMIFILSFQGRWGIHVLSIGSVVGELAQLIVLGFWLKHLSIPVCLKFNIHPALKKMGRLSVPPLMSNFVLEFNPLVDKIMIASTAVGSVTALNIATRWNDVPLMLLGTGGFMSVILAHWSKMKTEDSLQKVVDSVEKSLLMLSWIIIPFITVFFVVRRQVISFFYANNNFTQPDIDRVVLLWGILLISVIPNLLWRVIVRFYHVMQDTVTPFWIGIVRSVLNIILNFIAKYYFGLAGIAISTSLTAILLISFNFYHLDRKIKEFNLTKLIKSWLIMLGICLVSGLMANSALRLLDHLFLSTSRWYLFVSGSIAGMVCFLSYLVGSKLANLPELQEVVNAFKNRSSKSD